MELVIPLLIFNLFKFNKLAYFHYIREKTTNLNPMMSIPTKFLISLNVCIN